MVGRVRALALLLIVTAACGGAERAAGPERPAVERVSAVARDQAPAAGDRAAAPAFVPVAETHATYGTTTAPAAMVEGGEAPVEVAVRNTGAFTWQASGPDAVRLGYHWYDADGKVVVWDGARAALPRDLAPGDAATILVSVRAPRASGTFFLDFDVVQETKGWFSSRGVEMKAQRVVVSDGVTFYGRGWGHGIGLSQWGAQAHAQGAAGARKTGEQIVRHYFPGAELATHPASLPIRVLLSAPSTGCVGRTIGDRARMWSAGGMWLVDADDPTNVYADVGPYGSLSFLALGATLVVTSDGDGRTVVQGPGSVTLVPKQWWDPIAVQQKDLAYRGNIQVGTRDGGFLRVVNFVSSDDYMKGALPGEMPSHWEFEALRAQAITARTYAAWRQATAGDRTWDVRDDTADQCYGGRTFESARTTAAVESTPATILAYEGKPIRALYSSSHGGMSENVGCLLDAKKVGITWACEEGWPYLAPVQDPAEALARDIRGPNPYTSWTAHFTGAEIRERIRRDHSFDIGSYVSMELNLSPGGRPVSVRVRGTDGWVDLKGDRFLRTTLGLKSTLVRTTPF